MDINWSLDKCSQILLLGASSWLLSSVFGFIVNGWIAFIFFWIIGSFLWFIMTIQRINCEKKAVLITGCDSGFGFELAFHMEKLGFRVFAGCLLANKNGDGVKKLRESGSDKLHVLQMNVTDEKEILAARMEVDKLLPKDESLWAVINNAGLSTFGYLEWVPISTYKRMADVNVFGLIAVTKAFLPLIRQSKGRVVNVASMLGRIGPSMRSPYVATKYAVEGVSDCLRMEMKPHGIKVIVIEPGNYVAGTSILSPEYIDKQGKEMWASMSQETRDIYGEENFRSQMELMKTYATIGDTDITPVIKSFEEAVTQTYPQTRYQPMDLYYKTRIFVSTHFPECIHDWIYASCLQK
ncbi:UNVERIFIED_CONTAM: hypothetical protein RMT77_011832 [Armadillidium vulgare]